MLALRLRLSLSPVARQAPKLLVATGSRLCINHRTLSTSASKMASLKRIQTEKACPVAGPYSQAIVAGNTIYVSGQIPADVKGNLVEGSIADKTRACAQNVKAIVEAAGSSMENLVKCTVYLTDMANFAEMNGEFEKHFISKPSRTTIAVKQLPKGVEVEIEAIALL